MSLPTKIIGKRQLQQVDTCAAKAEVVEIRCWTGVYSWPVDLHPANGAFHLVGGPALEIEVIRQAEKRRQSNQPVFARTVQINSSNKM